ncbi:non-ribosomal peptide synthetase [Pseudoalteromonas rubra]|uniref:Carrier domain-containing protein n=1 Tax=Pseudoalteromonas rubra TaxID=43658 RepID=A0A0F4QGI5_9GAMM|nr:non-ribosomal peptide synthetase [Pseudoalteromonas rubra]KJZ06716.1 hypothetical protein TW77_18085 [Pseudoalteromonas rubra]
MRFLELLECIKDRQIKLKVSSEGQLAVVGNKENLTPALVSSLKTHKAEVINWLTQHDSDPGSIVRVDYGAEHDANAEQRGMWLSETVSNEHSKYNLVMAKRISGEFDPTVFEVALTKLAHRQKVFTTGFVEKAGALKQYIVDKPRIHCNLIDLQGKSKTEFAAAVDEILIAEGQKPFDFSAGNLLRAIFIKHSEQSAVLCITSHHIAMDAWSADIFDRELFEIYDSIIQERAVNLPELPVQYIDYVNWQHVRKNTKQFENSLTYWQSKLAGAPDVHSLPLKDGRPAKLNGEGALYQLSIDEDLTRKVKAAAAESNVTLFNFLFAVYTSVIHVHSQSNDIVVGVPMANRPKKELESLIGLFVNNAAIRIQLKQDWTFLDVLEQTKTAVHEAYAHQSVPFESILNTLSLKRNASVLPLIQLVFNFNASSSEETAVSDKAFVAEPYSTDLKRANFELLLSVTDELDSLSVLFEYNTQLFDKKFIAQFGRSFVNTLREVTHNVAYTGSQLTQAESRLAVANYAELYQQRVENTATDNQCIHQVFEQVVATKPDHIALKFKEQSLTYRTLNARANAVAAQLISKGISKEEVVGVCIQRSPEFFVAILAVLKAGGAYLPIDIEHPKERIEYMLSNSKVSKVLVDDIEVGYDFDGECFLLEHMTCTDNEQIEQNPKVECTSSNLAYVIYTSGSTGRPKGVMIEHQGVVNLASYHKDCFAVSSSSNVLQFASFSFDGAVWETVMALLNGASLHICSDLHRKSPEALETMLVDNQITHAAIPPSVLAHMNEELPYSFKGIIVAGEKTCASVVNRWAKKFALYNSYGPSEATVAVTGRWLAPNTDITVGCAIPNTKVYVLGTDKRVLGFGVQGELHVAGVGLARGYINSSDKNNSKFFYHDALQTRLYSTGDLVRMNDSGDVEFLGRTDDQVKVRGHRIELIEVEKQIETHSSIKSSKVIFIEDGPSSRLVAFFIQKKGAGSLAEQSATATLRNYLLAALPQYMVPASFISLERFPLTVNGKIDTASLLNQALNSEIRCGTKPRTDTQIAIAHIWAEILSIEVNKIYLESNFFELGGNSLLMVKLSKMLDEQFKIKIKANVVLGAESLEILALGIDKAITENLIIEKKLKSKIVSKGIL